MATIKIPESGNSDGCLEFDSRSLVLVGANGAGKSRLGIWIEDQHDNSHRIAAQRSLVFSEKITPRSTTEAKTMLLYGTYNERPGVDEATTIAQARSQKIGNRWGQRPESHLLSDFDHLLSLLVALHNRRNEKFVEDFSAGQVRDESDLPATALDQSLAVWHRVMPQRELTLTDNRLYASRVDADGRYSGLAMSDGERVAFYLIAQAMCAPAGSLVIVDEPEVHLHRAIESRLWNAIEAERSDCTFLYITHDLEFAASRNRADIIWVREYDGEKWKWDSVGSVDGFPTELTLEILGSRKPVLFVEGTRDSIDTLLYEKIYPGFHILAREGCAKVIESTIALREADGFHGTHALGVIDRDFRADAVIAGHEKDGVYTTPVAEAENALCLPCVVKAAATKFLADECTTLQQAKAASFEFLQHQLEQQTKERASQEIRHTLSQFSSKGIGNRDEFENAVDEFKGNVDPLAFYDAARKEYQAVIDSQDYEGLLRLFNNKGLEDKVAKAIGFSGADKLRDWVIAEIDASLKVENPSEVGASILAGLRKVFPDIPVPAPPAPNAEEAAPAETDEEAASA